MALKARQLQTLLREAVALNLDLYEGKPIEAVRQLNGWTSDLSEQEELQALEALRALRIIHAEQAPTTIVHAVATAPSLQGFLSIEGALGRVLDSCHESLLVISYTWSTEMMALISDVAARDRAITIVGHEADGKFRELVSFWKHPANKPVVLVAKGVGLMHVKAVVADRRHGYLGSANLTFGGFRNNLEFGVEFNGKLAQEVCAFVESQRKVGLLVDYGASAQMVPTHTD